MLTFSRQIIEEWIIVALYLSLGLGLPSKAARLRRQIGDQVNEARNMDVDALQETILWKMHDAVSRVVAAMILSALQFVHWILGRILRNAQNQDAKDNKKTKETKQKSVDSQSSHDSQSNAVN